MAIKVLRVDFKKCIGCRLCEQWCSISHYNIVNPQKARIAIVRDHEDFIDIPRYCHQCEDTPCIKACPSKINALSKDKVTGAVLVDDNKCILCKSCIKACPYDAIKIHPTNRHVLVCDLCGGDPECVKHCPEKAITYETSKEVI